MPKVAVQVVEQSGPDQTVFFPERLREAQRIVKFVVERLEGKHNDILYVCGNCGCGKTSTVERLHHVPFDTLTEATRAVTFCRINCADLTSKDFCARVFDATRKTRGRKKPTAVTAQTKITDLRNAIKDCLIEGETLRVVILDEVEAAEVSGITEIRKFCELVLKTGLNCTVAIIIVSNSKDLFHVDPKRLQSVTFQPYSTADLIAIANRTGTAVKMDKPAVQFAAQTCTVNYNGDVRKLFSLCAIAEDAAKGRADLATTRDLRQGIRDAPDSHVPTIRALPRQMLFVLCCCAKLHADASQGSTLPSLRTRDIYRAYEQTARRIGFDALGMMEVRSSLLNLVDLGLLSNGAQDVFGFCVHSSELNAALSGDASNVTAREVAGLPPLQQ